MNSLMVRIHPECDNIDPILSPLKDGDVGYDLKLWIPETIYIVNPQKMINIRTGVHIKLSTAYCCEIRSRSSTFAKRKLFIMGGTIDEGYTGELSIFIWNPTLEAHTVTNGDRLAQLVIHKRYVPNIEFVSDLPVTSRGASGFGSTDTVES